MKLKLTKKQISEIAENLDIGLRCFYRPKTGEIKTLIVIDDWLDKTDELIEQEHKEIEDNITEYIEFDKLTSYESFSIMESFAEKIDNKDLQEKLINALNRAKPFRNFKWLIDNSGDYRQKWFDHKNQKAIEFVEKQVEEYNELSDQ